jgi:hypothetical protein
VSATLTDVQYSTVLEALACSECGLAFGLPADFRQRRRQDHATFYCPNGHRQHYPQQSDAEKYKALYEQEQRRLETARRDADHQREQRQAEERRVRSLKGVITRTKRRVAHGVCPCCNRTFKDLASHMEGQHPDYVKTAADAPAEA